MPRNLNDGRGEPPHLKIELNMGNLEKLPDWSSAPRASDPEALLAALRRAGFDGTQGGDPAASARLGMSVTGSARIDRPGQIGDVAARCRDEGHAGMTVHVGWGMEDDAAVDALVGEINQVSDDLDFPVYIETHRATVTQDNWRTVQLLERLPDTRFNGDFSHWYTGHEMVYGGFEAKLAFIAPVLERVRYIHGRIGDPGCIQVDIGDGEGRGHVDHFRRMWTRAMAGFLESAGPGD